MRLKHKRLTLLLFLVMAQFQMLPSFAQSAPPQSFDLNKWITYYYLKPEPDLTVQAILAMSEGGYFDKSSSLAALAAFFSQVFAQNPESIQQWFSKLGKLPQHHKRALWEALWYSATPQGLAQLKQEANIVDNPEKSNLLKMISESAPSIATLEITSPAVLDMFWASFMASGDPQFVLRIISALPWSDQKEDVSKLLIGGSARWSLTSNCIQHPKVLEICKDQVIKQGGTTKRILQDVVKQAETTKK